MRREPLVYCVNASKGLAALPSRSVPLIVTDPPYELTDMAPYFTEMLRVLRADGSIYVFGDKDVIAEHWFRQLRVENKTLLAWHYENSPKPRGRWRLSMQCIIYGYREGSVFHQDDVRIEYREATKKLNGRVRPSAGRLGKGLPYDTSRGALPRDVLLCPALLGHLSRERVGHPDQKPLALIRRLILASSARGDLVLDPFAGSGTTLVAAIEAGRRALGFEIDPSWAKKANARALNAGGKSARA